MDIQKIRAVDNPKVLVFGNHPGIIQSVLDFDYLAGKPEPSIVAIIGVQQRLLKFFWGNKEITIPGLIKLSQIDSKVAQTVSLFAVAQSGRRAIEASEEALESLPNVLGGMIFAEGVPERHSLRLRRAAQKSHKFVLGPASVGFLIGGSVKLGAIGGTLPEQVVTGGITRAGSIAVISTSGGMINELITMIASSGSAVSFAAAVGGERFPVAKPAELVQAALNDKQTKAIVYFGELGGDDEYKIAELYEQAKEKKPLVAYIAGTVAESFENAPQFGHAKSMAQNLLETATAKKEILSKSGASVAKSFADFESQLSQLPKTQANETWKATLDLRLASIEHRTPSMFVNNVSSDKGGDVTILGVPLMDFVTKQSLSDIALSMFLGKEPKSQRFKDFFDVSLRLLVDHGPQVSGAVNTMITARAGRDVTASLASGILTIGPRFGGAISIAAEDWLHAVNNNEAPSSFIERFAHNKVYISGIGHKKYRSDNPDSRVKYLLAKFDNGGKYTAFAKQVEAITIKKKAQLILNVDGAMAALLLDILSESEGYDNDEIEALLSTDFCNAIFVLARSVGFIAHFMEQRRLDEGLFRLRDQDISSF